MNLKLRNKELFDESLEIKQILAKQSGETVSLEEDKVAELEDFVTELKISHSAENIANLEEAVNVLSHEVNREKQQRMKLETKFKEFLQSDISVFYESEAISALSDALLVKEEELRKTRFNQIEKNEAAKQIERS